MCAPLMAAIPAISAVAGIGSAAAAGLSYMGQQSANAANQKANDDWVAYQRAASARNAAADQANREKEQAALGNTEAQLTQPAQSAVQGAAATSLNDQMLAGSPASNDVNTTALGLDQSADTSVTQDIGQRVTNAAREAQGRIKALAGLQSYGNGYQGMGAAANTALTNSGEDITLGNDFRKGDTSTLAISQAVQPVTYKAGADVGSSIASGLANIAGSAFGTANNPKNR